MSRFEPFAILSRRRLLKLALSGGAVVAGGLGGLVALRGRAPQVAGLRLLSDHEYRTMAALASAAFPDLGPGGALEGRVDLARAFDAYLADEPSWAQTDARRALMLLELGPVLFERRLSTFSNLPAAERLEHFQRWGASASEVRRQVALGLRKFLALMFYDQPPVWPGIGYEGPLIRAGGEP